MTYEEVLAALDGYNRELEGILSRFKKDHNGIHIQDRDDGRFREMALELLHLFEDEFVNGGRHSQVLAAYFNDSTYNMSGTPSYQGVENVKGVVASALVRVQRNPMAIKSRALVGRARGAKDSDVVVTIAERLHRVIRQLRERRESRPTLDVNDEYDVQDLFHALLLFALARDPGARFDLWINLSAQQRSELGSDVEERIRPFVEIQNSQTFRSPHAPRLRDEPPYLYDLHPEDDERLTCEYETADDNVSILDSERVELRDRMKGWLRFQGLEYWEDFRFSTPRERWKVEVRALQGAVMANEPIHIPFPQRLRLAFGDSEIETLIAAGRSKQSAVLRWLSRASSVGVDAQLSRDWHEPEPD
jgi:hypothetical protein